MIPKKFALTYSYVPDILEKRTPYRSDHLAMWEELVNNGILVAGGAFSPPEGALFLINSDSKETVEEFVRKVILT